MAGLTGALRRSERWHDSIRYAAAASCRRRQGRAGRSKHESRAPARLSSILERVKGIEFDP